MCRGLRRALEEANLNTATSSPAGRSSQTPSALPKQPAINEQASTADANPASDSENQQPGNSQVYDLDMPCLQALLL